MRWNPFPDASGFIVFPLLACFQGHIDMVCEKNSDVQHDFYKDPLTLVRDGDWLTARGTTLGKNVASSDRCYDSSEWQCCRPISIFHSDH